MKAIKAKRVFMFLIAVFSMSLMVGCSYMGVEKGLKDREGGFNKPGYDYYHKPLPEADRALNEARAAGKDKQCPAEFEAAKNMVDKSYEIYIACHTDEAIAMAQESIAKINALCPRVEEVEQKKEAQSAVSENERVIINIEFDTNKANVKSKYNEEIKRFADVMKRHPDWNIVIEGHTDNLGGAENNRLLSKRRADSVRDYMIKNFGIDASRIKAEGYGMSKPIASNETSAGRQKNRRVEAVTNK